MRPADLVIEPLRDRIVGRVALEDQIDKQKAANKQIEDQIAALKDRLRADVCTAKDPLGKNPPGSTPAALATASMRLLASHTFRPFPESANT